MGRIGWEQAETKLVSDLCSRIVRVYSAFIGNENKEL
jgi:hypothetical protein